MNKTTARSLAANYRRVHTKEEASHQRSLKLNACQCSDLLCPDREKGIIIHGVRRHLLKILMFSHRVQIGYSRITIR